MATKKRVENKERAAVGRERRLALALVAFMDADTDNEQDAATGEAKALLDELGYNDIESTAKRLKRLEADLSTAIELKDYAHVAELGRELEKAKAGKFHRVAKESE